jgi:hypothetical protein
MSKFENCSSDFFCACEKQGVPSTRFVLIVSVANQTVSLFGKTSLRSGGRQTAAFSGSLPRAGTGEFQFVKKFRCSICRFGADSFPLLFNRFYANMLLCERRLICPMICSVR